MRGGGGGGGIEFADVEAKDAMEIRQWDPSAPSWRIVNPGICLEGKCQTATCEAKGNMVIYSHGMRNYDLLADNAKPCCPICKEWIPVITCGFSQCKWKWTGKKQKNHTSPPVKCDSGAKWQIAENAYHRFDALAGEGPVIWSELKFLIKSAAS